MELAELQNTRDSEAKIIFSDDGSTNKKCSCSRTWVLVVHNDFLQVEGYERNGNDVDLENLRRVWKYERQCKFAELANCTSAQIIGTLSSGEKLSQLFHPRNSTDPDGILCEPPEVFLLFVLSHGESGGKILTDHLKSNHTNQKDSGLMLETYETCDVWNSLMGVHLLKSCVKILFFAPCRGLKPEVKHNPSNKTFEEAADVPTTGFLASNPNHEDLIIFYATVETTFSNRNELQGTWFVQSICSVLDSLVESEDILLFFTKVQYHICQRTLINCWKENVGQTPQLHLFASEHIQFCASHTALELSFSKYYLSDCLTKPDCRPKDKNEIICFNATDAKRSNAASELIKLDRAIFYNWGQEHNRYRRGSALIFHDYPHIYQALSMGNSFKKLDYDVKIYSTGDIMIEIAKTSLKKKFKHDASLVLCVLAQLEETNAGLTLQIGNKSLLLSQIVDELSVIKCKNLIGKPKLLFVIDEGTKQDKPRPTPELEELQFSNTNAGICLFVGTRACPDESVTEQLTSMLAMEELKNGQLCLQFALAHLIKKISAGDTDVNEQSIKPQLISTLPVLVDFPPLLKQNKPFSTKMRIFVAAGITVSVIVVTLLLSLFTRNGSNFTQVHISDNCMVGFSDGNSDQVDAFTYNQSTWKTLSENCNSTWKAAHEKEFISLSFSNAGALKSAVDHVKSVAPFTQSHLKLVILFSYNNPGDLQKTLAFVAALATDISQELMVQSCIDIYHRMESFKQLNDIEVLPFWKLIQKESLQAKLNFSSQLNELNSAGIDKICNHISNSSNIEYLNQSIAFLKLDDSTKLFFIPHIFSNCHKKKLIVKEFYQYIASMGKVACEGLNLTFLLMKSDYNLAHSEQPLKLREICASKNDNEICKEVVKNIKHLHFMQLQTAFETFEENCTDPKELQDEVFNYFPELVEDIYKGDSKNVTRLAKFLWSAYARQSGNITCRNTLFLMEQMSNYNKLNSVQALVVFTYMSEKYDRNVRNIKNCTIAIGDAPHIVKNYILGHGVSCPMNPKLDCFYNNMNYTNSILMEHKNSDGSNFSSPYPLLFVGFLLHSMREIVLQSDVSRTKQLFILMEKTFKEMYVPLYDKLTKDYFFQQHSRCNSVVPPRKKEIFEAYFYNVVFRRAFAKFGLTIANLMICRLDGILAINRSSLTNTQIFCNITTYLFAVIESKKSAIYGEEALALFLFLENYNNLLKDNKSSNDEVVKAYNKCSSAFGNVTKLVQGKLDYFLQTWNDEKLQPELLKWHKKFQLSSAWLLPKLVQHVINNNDSQNLLQLTDFFSVLSNQSYSEPLGICPGLLELSQQIFIHPISFDNAIKEKVRQLISYIDYFGFNDKLIIKSISYMTFKSTCNQASIGFRDVNRNHEQ